MSKDNSKFFEKKQIWSEVKDQLLGCYLRPYIQKILATRRPVFYVDCFAGKGRFGDGKDGSPRIALEIIDGCINSTTIQESKIESCYIDLNYADDLRKNLIGYRNVSIISGKYEENIEKLLQSRKGYNIFLYIDPYGIKALDCRLFDKFAEYGFNSIELLINLNSFGFMREACRAKKIIYSGIEAFDDIIEYDPTTLDSSAQSIQALTDIAGGNYWEKIIDDFKSKRIDGYAAEKIFANEYCNRLHQKYKYILNMPIRLQQGQRPKYRMIHATNHADGCLLMYENICKRWEVLDDIQTGGQYNLFSTSIDDDIVDIAIIKNRLRDHIQQYSKATSLSIVLAEFLTQNGVLCKKTEIVDMLQEFEENDEVIVIRTPNETRKGKSTKFFTETSKQHILIRRKQ